jgi:hypothetical protein
MLGYLRRLESADQRLRHRPSYSWNWRSLLRYATLRAIARWAKPDIVVTLAESAALNGFAFMQGAW